MLWPTNGSEVPRRCSLIDVACARVHSAGVLQARPTGAVPRSRLKRHAADHSPPTWAYATTSRSYGRGQQRSREPIRSAGRGVLQVPRPTGAVPRSRLKRHAADHSPHTWAYATTSRSRVLWPRSAAVGRANPLCCRVASGRGRSAGRAHAIQVSRDESVSALLPRASREGFVDRCRVAHVQSANVLQARSTDAVPRWPSQIRYAQRRNASRINISRSASAPMAEQAASIAALASFGG